MTATVVGMDLDMTLIDPRPGVVATAEALSAVTGVSVDGQRIASHLGPPLNVALAEWFAEDALEEACDLFRDLYVEHAIPRTTLLPGAVDAVAAVREQGGQVVVITAKLEANAVLTLDHLGLVVDDVVGWRWGPQKTETLVERGACLYVGDHVSDVHAARGAGVPCVAVTSGPCRSDELAEAGAAVVMETLAEFRPWWGSARMGG